MQKHGTNGVKEIKIPPFSLNFHSFYDFNLLFFHYCAKIVDGEFETFLT